MVIVNYSSSKEIPSRITNVVKNQMRLNSHGFSFHAVINNNDIVLRTLDGKKYISELKNVTKMSLLLHIHLRLASAGAVSEQNIHMWKLGNYHISHNGSVSQFASRYSYSNYHISHNGSVSQFASRYSYSLYNSLHISESRNGEKSDTLQLIETSEFVNAVNNINKPSILWNVLTKYGFYGVMFMTSKDKVIAVSKAKPIHIYCTDDLLIFVNKNVFEKVKNVKRFGFKFSYNMTLHTSYVDTAILYDVKAMKPVFYKPKQHSYYYSYRGYGKWWK
jgi:hypothetical protein